MTMRRDAEFDAEVDASHSLTIEGVSVRVSDALAGLPETYAQVRLVWQERREEEFRNRVTWEYPFPIAVRFHRASQQVEYSRRLEHLRDTWHAAITLAAAVVLAEIVHKGIDAAAFGIDPGKLTFHNIRNPIDILDRCVLGCGNRLSIFSGLGPEEMKEAISLMVELNNERNGLAHVEALPENHAKERFKYCEPKVMRILSLLRNLANGDLVSVADVDKLHYHRGISPEASTRSVALAEAQYLQLHAPGRPPKRDLFWLEEGGAYCLSPLLRRADAEDSQQFRLFFLDDVKTEERRLVYLTYGFITRCDTADAKPGFHTTAVLEDRDVLLVDYENLRDRFRSKTRTPKRKPHSAPPQATGEQQKGRILRLARS